MSTNDGERRNGNIYLSSSSWHQALSLAERAAVVRDVTNPTENGVNFHTRRADRHFNLWLEQEPFDDPEYFQRRLTQLSLNNDSFRGLLSADPATFKGAANGSISDWLDRIATAFCTHTNGKLLWSAKAPESTSTQVDRLYGFLNIIAPLISDGLERFRTGIAALRSASESLPFDTESVESLILPQLEALLIRRLSRTLVLELNVARLKEELSGNTAEERFLSFVSLLKQSDYALAILEEYPILARQAVIVIDNWSNATLEFLRHLVEDWEEIRGRLHSSENPGTLIKLSAGAGDSHRGGRSVMIAQFESGVKIVYKPHSLAVDIHVQELLSWLNDHGAAPAFPSFLVIDKGDHGWAEFVEPCSCTSQQEIKRFYQRQGAYLALLYALEATDFHGENLIASGENPVLVDLETFFHPSFSKLGRYETEPAAKALNRSVMRSLLLPQRVYVNEKDGYGGVDLSGLGSEPGQLSPDELPYYEASGTDEMHLKRRRMEMGDTPNRPRLDNKEVALTDYAEDFINGFTGHYNLLKDHRNELLAPDGPIERFAGDQVRVVLRATRTYASLLQESFHPDMLRDSLDRDRFYDQLWADVENNPRLERVIPSELADLHSGDIPVFTTFVDSHDLWNSHGQKIPDFLDKSGLEQVSERLNGFCDADLEQQLWIIRTSLETLTPVVGQGKGHLVENEVKLEATRERLIAEARSIADRLVERALYGDKRASWLSLVSSRPNSPVLTVSAAGESLYDGVAGIGLFFAYLDSFLERQTDETPYCDIAEATLETVLALAKHKTRKISHGTAGLGGTIYFLTHLAELWHRPDLIAIAHDLAGRLHDAVEKDENYDIISGCAGNICGLEVLNKASPDKALKETIAKCADHLIATALQMDRGIAWPVPIKSFEPLSGFAHGVAGISLALLKAYAVTGDERYKEAALSAIWYENSLFSLESDNWPDLRDYQALGLSEKTTGAPAFAWAWCYGAPGIGMARLASLAYNSDGEIRDDIERALESTWTRGSVGNDSLCHGDLGNAELIFMAGKLWPETKWSDRSGELVSNLFGRISERGIRCGLSAAQETPGLMTGIAGIGYQLLRFAAPEQIPSILTFEAPRISQKP